MTRHRTLVAAAAALAVSLTGTLAHAWWTDTATATTTAGAHVVAYGDYLRCRNRGGLAGLLGYAEVSWPQVDPRYDYDYTVTRIVNGDVRAEDTIIGPSTVGATMTLDVTTSLINVALPLEDFRVAITPRVKGTTWAAATPAVVQIESFTLLVLGLSTRCDPEVP